MQATSNDFDRTEMSIDLPMPSGPNKDMWLALIEHDNEKLVAALRAGANANQADEWKTAPIMLAVLCENYPAAEILARYGAVFPAPAKGAAYSAYFDVTPEPYDPTQIYHCVELAIKHRDVQMQKLLCSLPGAVNRLYEEDWREDQDAAVRIAIEGDSRHLQALIEDDIRCTLGQHTLTPGLERIIRDLAYTTLAPAIALLHHGQPFVLKNTTDLAEQDDALIQPRGVRALSFKITHTPRNDTGAPLSGASWSPRVLTLDHSRGEQDAYQLGTWSLSAHAVIRGAVRTGLREWSDDDGNRGLDEVSETTGTIYIAEEPADLARYIRETEAIGPTIALIEALRENDTDSEYAKATKAIAEGADSALPFFGWVPADSVAGASGRVGVLRALLDHDRLTQGRLKAAGGHIESALVETVRAPVYGSIPLCEAAVAKRLIPSVDAAIEDAGLMLLDASVSAGLSITGMPDLLWSAIARSRERVVDALLALGVDPNLKIGDEGPALQVSNLSEELSRKLIAAGANADAPGLLEDACLSGRRWRIEMLLESGADASRVLGAYEKGDLRLRHEATVALLRSTVARRAIGVISKQPRPSR